MADDEAGMAAVDEEGGASHEEQWTVVWSQEEEGDARGGDAIDRPVDGACEGSEVSTSSSPGPLGLGQWVEQFDPTTRQPYFYNVATGATQWERPGDFVDGVRDERVDGVVRIQSAVRSRQARARAHELETANASSVPETSAPAGESGLWRQHFDPRSGQHYYHNVLTDEVTWTRPEGEPLADADPAGDSATRIQCAFRQRTASRSAERKRGLARDITSPEAVATKLRDLMRAVDEIDAELAARQRTIAKDIERYPHLEDALASWGLSARAIRDRVLDHHHHGELLRNMDMDVDKVARAKEFHELMASTRSECLSLLKNVLLMSSFFLEADVRRVNEAFATFTEVHQREICHIRDPKTLKIIQRDELEAAIDTAEKQLRRAMGMTDFAAGKTAPTGKTYEGWRQDATNAVDAVDQLCHRVEYATTLLQSYQQSMLEKKELLMMTREDALSSKQEQQLRRQIRQKQDHGKFLELCRQSWQKGLQRLADDEHAKQLREKEGIARQHQSKDTRERQFHAEREHRAKVKLSIWEAVKEGRGVDVIRAMIYAEMHKARQNGFDFNVKTARSDRGESLVQLACWWGHENLVVYLLDEGADLRGVDSFYNKFTLLHDAARRGNASIIRLLLERGLPHDVVDGAGDTPLHWAVRLNHYDAVHTLLGAYLHRPNPHDMEKALKALRTANHRGRTPLQIAKSECIRRLLQAFDDGRVPLFRKTLSGGLLAFSTTATHPLPSRRMTELPHPSMNVHTSHLEQLKIPLAKAQTSKVIGHRDEDPSSEGPHPHGPRREEDEFGVINVVTSRLRTPPTSRF